MGGALTLMEVEVEGNQEEVTPAYACRKGRREWK